MYLSIDFQRDGEVRVFWILDGVSMSVCGPVERLRALLPEAVCTEACNRMATVLGTMMREPEPANGAPRLTLAKSDVN